MKAIAVIGKNFGDEGKGMAVDFLALHSEKPLVVRHNGGAQSGPTVEYKENGKKFLYHELSSASFRGVDTLWSNTFYPDIYKLSEEIEAFRNIFGFVPNIYAMNDTCITTPDDVLLNMALESSRGDSRHGSCGMGINECDLRTAAGYGLMLSAINGSKANDLYKLLLKIRTEYLPKRLKEISGILTHTADEYLQLLSNDTLLENAAKAICNNLHYINILSDDSLKEKLKETGTLIFESGQGLLLDRNNKKYAPHLTCSETGLANPSKFLKRFGYFLDEAIYVSRTYVTKHGAGTLPNQCPRETLGNLEIDRTNEPNEWQGAIRYARHGNTKEFVSEVQRDIKDNDADFAKKSLFLTHLNETDNCVMMKDKNIPVEQFIKLPEIKNTFDNFYFSGSHYSEDTTNSLLI